jgi:glycerol-3-phosphate acyltransferase PlsX
MGSVFASTTPASLARASGCSTSARSSKGNDLVRDSYQLLERTRIHFCRERGGARRRRADVVVCDGFVGNVILKFSESIYLLRPPGARRDRRGVMAKAGALLMKRAFSSVRSQLDYAEYGGAPLLGVKGGDHFARQSSRRAIRNAILVAAECELNVNRHIEEAVQFRS